jgi:hypothetical protein
MNTDQLAIGDFSGFDAAKMAKIKFTEHQHNKLDGF